MPQRRNRTEIEIGLAEGAKVADVSRTTAYIMARAGEIAGARKIGDRLWVAPRVAFEALRDRVELKRATR